jgi:hypothetical protein
MTEFYLSTPQYYLLFCLIVAIVISGILYFRNHKEKEFSSPLKIILSCLRGLSVGLLVLLLLQPFVKKIFNQSQKPILFVAQDVSSSIKSEVPDIELNQFQLDLENMTKRLEKKYEIKTYSLGDQIRPGLDTSFNDQASDLSSIFKLVKDQYKDANKAGIILASDGIYNLGSNPVYSNQTGLKVHSILLGDTTSKKDLLIKRVFHNDIAYLDDQFNVLVDIVAKNIQLGVSKLSIYKDNGGSKTLLEQKTIEIKQANFFTTEEFFIQASEVGNQKYSIELSPLKEEQSTANNLRSFRIEVIDARQKVLLLAAAPHPDLFAIRSALEAQGNIDVNLVFLEEADKTDLTEQADLLILHQLPNANTSKLDQIVQKFKTQKTPLWYIVGMDTNIKAFNEAQNLVEIQDYIGSYNESFGVASNTFNLFKVDEELKSQIIQYPPLLVPFGSILNKSGAVLFNQKIGSVDTDYPLLSMNDNEGQKTAILLGTGIWKWRLFHYMQYGNHTEFDKLIQNTVQYLGSKEDKRKFRVRPSKNKYLSNEEILFDAELFNANYERVNDPEVEMTLTDETGNNFEYVFSRRGDAYSLNLRKLNEGNYSFSATTSFNGEAFKQEGSISVTDLNLESLELTADLNLLNLLSSKSNGSVFNSLELDKLEEMLLEDENVKEIIYSESRTFPLIDNRWIFLIIFMLLGIEWFLRRFKGSY